MRFWKDTTLKALGGLAVVGFALVQCKGRPSPEKGASSSAAVAVAVPVAAASDLALAFRDVGALLEKRGQGPYTFTFGSSGLLARQIQEGAPYEVLAVAQMSLLDELVRRGTCDGTTARILGEGRLVLVVPPDMGRELPGRLEDLKGPKYARLAMAHPDHAPYGKAAREALQSLGLWASLEGRVVYGENVQQALQFAQTGNVDAAFVAASLVRRGPSLAVPPHLHGPLRQGLVLCGKGPNHEGARTFAAFLTSAEGQNLLAAYGFRSSEGVAGTGGP